MKNIVPGYRTDAWTKGLAGLGIDDAQLGAELGNALSQSEKCPHSYMKILFMC